ncbi:MAG: hypothetical protein LBI13_04805 [Streptococcaceae bacterium]|nr:hypothetical protein [Streptococcaceae bacterium]
MKKLLLILSVLFMVISLSACTNTGGKKMNSEGLTQKQSEEIQIKIAKAFKNTYKGIESIKFSGSLGKTPWTDETGWHVDHADVTIDGIVYHGFIAGFGSYPYNNQAGMGVNSIKEMIPDSFEGVTNTMVTLIMVDGKEVKV